MNGKTIKAVKYHKNGLLKTLSEHFDTSDIERVIDGMIDELDQMRLKGAGDAYRKGYKVGYVDGVAGYTSVMDGGEGKNISIGTLLSILGRYKPEVKVTLFWDGSGDLAEYGCHVPNKTLITFDDIDELLKYMMTGGEYGRLVSEGDDQDE